MRITVVRTEGVPDGCILSVRAGDQRRQMPLSCEGQTICLDGSAVNGSRPLRVDLLDTLASFSTEDSQACEHEFKLEPTRLNGRPKMRLVVRLEPGAGKVADTSSKAVIAKENATVAKAFGGLGREAKIAGEAQSYLQSHDLLRSMRAALSRVLRDRPADPRTVMAEELMRVRQPGTTKGAQPTPGAKADAAAAKPQPETGLPKVETPETGSQPPRTPPAAASRPASGAAGTPEARLPAGTPPRLPTSARVPVAAPEMAKQPDAPGSLREMDFFSVPSFPSTLPLRILDLGSSEVGFYCYGEGTATQQGEKMKATFLEDWVRPGKVEEFAEELIKRYGILELSSHQGSFSALTFIAGATGVNREALQQNHEEREVVRRFICDVEGHLAARAQRPCQISLFVPSGPLEAQYELRAVEWLLEQLTKDLVTASLRGDLPARMTGEGFSPLSPLSGTGSMMSDAGLGKNSLTGTISAGGGSSQLSIRRGQEAVQLFSVPLGNRKPASDKLFSVPPTVDEVSAWATRFRNALRQAAFPHGLSGLFVGISATFYAAKEAGCADCVISKNDAMAALTARLEQCTGGDPSDASLAKSAANVALVRELLDWVLASDAQILFRRNWVVNGEPAAATWTLGLYAEAESSMLRAAAIENLGKDGNAAKAGEQASNTARLKQCFMSTPIAVKYKERWKKYVHKIADRRAKHERLRDFGGIIFSVPLVICDNGPSLLLDISKNRIGFYSLRIDPRQRRLLAQVAAVLGRNFEDEFIATRAADTFAAEVIARFALTPGNFGDGEAITISAGATGEFRTRLAAEPELRDRCAGFLRAVEERLEERLRREVRVDVFVPSMDLVAKLELNAIEWLLNMFHKHSGVHNQLECFTGTVAVTSTHLRLTMRPPSSSASRALQTYTTEIQDGMDVCDLQQALVASGFPRGLSGLFLVTTEDACALAEAAGIGGGPATTGVAVDALQRRAEDPHVDTDVSGKSMLRTMSTLLTWSLERQFASVIFRHSWHVGEASGCAPLWALGLMTTQSEDEELAASVAAARIQVGAAPGWPQPTWANPLALTLDDTQDLRTLTAAAKHDGQRSPSSHAR